MAESDGLQPFRTRIQPTVEIFERPRREVALNSVRHRLVLVVAIGLAPILAFLGHTELEARRVRHQLMQEEALRLVRLVAYDEQRIIGDAEQTLNVISGGPSVKRGLLSLCQQFLQNIVQESPRYVDVTVIGTDGRVTCAPDPTQIGIDLSDRVYFRDALLKNETIVGEYSIGPTSKVPSIAIAKRFTDQAGTIAGVVEVSLNLDWVQRQVEQLDLPEGATAGFTDRSGIILARQPYNPSIVGHPILAANRFILEGDKIEVRSNIQTRDGRELMLAYMPPGGQAHGLGISVGLDPRITFAEITRVNRSGVLF